MRMELVISCWGKVRRKMLGATATNEDKVEMEGAWNTSHIILGFEVDANEIAIKIPGAEKLDACHFSQDAMLNPCNRIITVGKIQELRGLINRWSYAYRFWHYMASPVNGLMAFADSTET